MGNEVYEWRLFGGMLLGQPLMTVEFFTDTEIETLELLKSGLFKKIENTKRVRPDVTHNHTR